MNNVISYSKPKSERSREGIKCDLPLSKLRNRFVKVVFGVDSLEVDDVLAGINRPFVNRIIEIYLRLDHLRDDLLQFTRRAALAPVRWRHKGVALGKDRQVELPLSVLVHKTVHGIIGR